MKNKDCLNEVVKKELDKKIDKFFQGIMDFVFVILLLFSSFTLILIGVYLLPIIINLSPIIKEFSWIPAIGILGFGILPYILIIKIYGKKENVV